MNITEDEENKRLVDKFLEEAPMEDQPLLRKIQSTFQYWMMEEKTHRCSISNVKWLKKRVLALICLYLLSLAIGYTLSYSKSISLYFVSNFTNSVNSSVNALQINTR